MEVTAEAYPAAYMGESEDSEIPLPQLFELLQVSNIAEILDEDELKRVGIRCVTEYETDLESRSEWWEKAQEGIKLAKQVAEDKSYPWPNAANVKYPLMAEAAITFAARAYPELVKGDVIGAEVVGNDPNGEKEARADRVRTFMANQLRHRMSYWEEETDNLLVQLPLVGSMFRKSYYDEIDGKTCSHLVSADNFIVNHNIKSLDQARRETEVVELYGNDVEERMRSGIWKTVELSVDPREGIPDEDKPYTFIEQHRWLDLDGDGYEEPYIVTVHTTTRNVVSIARRFDYEDVTINQDDVVIRIQDERYYTHYPFMPNPDGGLYGVGLGSLLLPINEAVNTILNQLLDAGTLANLQGGFLAKGIRVKAGAVRVKPGEWKVLDTGGLKLSESVHALPFKEPSNTLYALLGTLIDAGKSLANLKDVLTGDVNPQVQPTTLMALIEQGQKVYSAIYKRIYRAMGIEFKRLYKLNSMYVSAEQYQNVLEERADPAQDFNSDDYDVCPVADPTISSQTQRLARAQALMAMKDEPGMQREVILMEQLEALGITNPERFYSADAAKQAGEMNQAMMEMEADLKDREAGVKEQEQARKAAETDAKIEKMAHEQALAELEQVRGDYDGLNREIELEKESIKQAGETQRKQMDNELELERERMRSDVKVLIAQIQALTTQDNAQEVAQGLQEAREGAASETGDDAMKALVGGLTAVIDRLDRNKKVTVKRGEDGSLTGKLE